MEIVLVQGPVSFRRYAAISLRFTFRKQPILLIPLVLLPLIALWLLGHMILAGNFSIAQLLQDNPVSFVWLVAPLLPVQTLWSLRRQYRASPFLHESVVYKLSSAGVDIRSPSLNTDLAWPAITQAQQFGPWLLLQTSGHTAFFFDLQSVIPPAGPTDILTLLQAGAVSVR